MEERAGWFRLVLGLSVVFGIFHGTATMLASDRGQHGVLIAAFVVSSTAAIQRFLLRRLLSMPWPIALASVLLAVVISFPLAHLFELGGDTIWAPALLHFVIQGAIKLLVLGEGAEAFAINWMIASAVVPLLVFVRYPVWSRGTGDAPSERRPDGGRENAGRRGGRPSSGES